MLGIFSKSLRTATRTEDAMLQRFSHYNMILHSELEKARKLRTRQTFERRLDNRW